MLSPALRPTIASATSGSRCQRQTVSPPSIRSITFPWDSAVARIVACMKLWNLSGIGLPDWSTTEAAPIDAPGRM